MERRKRILIVDGNPVNIELLQGCLEDVCPDLVLLDVMMPGIDGYETCRQLRQKPFLSHVPIIFISAKAFESEQQQGHEAGSDDDITKIFRLQLLAEKKITI